ncbi:MAG: Exopolyphosphatase (EC [uncultured Sulfurovum sp.]|uniref:Exopolyphosphatase (EC) n=1 Tax=uncultured Sulfurovum sp. TaxID=269237 RepID=A0A6S6T6J0_9BACT|nr:MAG: Exopolyphosphatase (EC [uncultured Sulfurovum sp.]
MKHIIAIDLGSNSLRLLKMDRESKASLGTFHKTVKTADGLAKTGKINDEALSRVVCALNEAKEVLDFKDAKVKAVTTEAIRQAKNGLEVLKSIADQTGIRFEVIDGVAEARYALKAAQNRLERLGQTPESFMLVDIGGGSTEMLFYYGEEKCFSKSFQVGIVTVTQKYNDLEAIAKAIPSVMSSMKSYYDEVVEAYGELEVFIATAGTPTTIAAMKKGMNYETYDPERIHGTVLTQKDLEERLGELLAMSQEERIVAVGVGRDDLIASGVLIYNELYTISGFETSMVIDDGIREGIAFDESSKG